MKKNSFSYPSPPPSIQRSLRRKEDSVEDRRSLTLVSALLQASGATNKPGLDEDFGSNMRLEFKNRKYYLTIKLILNIKLNT